MEDLMLRKCTRGTFEEIFVTWKLTTKKDYCNFATIKRCDNKDVWYYFLKLTSLQIKSFFSAAFGQRDNKFDEKQKRCILSSPTQRSWGNSFSFEPSFYQSGLVCFTLLRHHFAKISVEPFGPIGSFASVCSFTGLWESAKPNNVEEPN